MPITLTFDLEGATSLERNRIQCAFERLGWMSLGGSAYRYPRLDSKAPEDWFNHVVPALMLLRTFLTDSGKRMSCYTIDVQASVGVGKGGSLGMPASGMSVLLHHPTNKSHFSEGKLREWLSSISHPYR